jgi:branched-chain amino acid transport system ATP-binding protein
MPNTCLLRLDHVEVVYDQVILAVRDISMQVPHGGIVALLGANGAGKSTVLKAASRLIEAEHGQITRGTIHYDGQPITSAQPAALVRQGLVQVLEGRHCFPNLTIEENLLTGAYCKPMSRAQVNMALEKMYAFFPRLKAKRKLQAGYTSGGEQQMAALGRALMSSPRLLLLDEPSMGLAPQVVEEIFEIVGQLHRSEGTSFLIAEQNTAVALRYAQYAYVMENGQVVAEGPAREFEENGTVSDLYFGAAVA